MDRERVDVVVIGAGVVGLAIARALALGGREVLVLEANPAIGQETSSRNSEVIHAGLYYPPGSLKARSCVRGMALLYDYCQRKGVHHRRCGKLIVASSESQTPALRALQANAAACGVTTIEWVDRARCRILEPRVRAVAGLWSPATGIVDSHALMLALQADLEAAGGTVACNAPVDGGRIAAAGIELDVAGTQRALAANGVINAAGLHSPQVAQSLRGLPASTIPAQQLVRGHYYGYTGRAPFQHLVYPLPDADGLGIHATLDLAGQLRFGPDAEHVDRIDYAFDDGRRERFAEAIERWYPELDRARLQPGYVGIRPRLNAPRTGFPDFVVSSEREHGIPGLVNLFGIESPGLTACLALGEGCAAALGGGPQQRSNGGDRT